MLLNGASGIGISRVIIANDKTVIFFNRQKSITTICHREEVNYNGGVAMTV